MGIYSRIIVVGTGAVANSCALCVKKSGELVELVESRQATVATCKQFCEKQGINYQQLSGETLKSFFTDINEPTLIISAANRYLFPYEIINKNNITIINYHGALLPKHPGRNAEAWAIYEDDAEAGITWHTVVSDVDAGDILIQKVVPLTDNTTSLSLLRVNSKLVVEALEEILAKVLDGTIVGTRQTEKYPLHFSWQKPNDGVLDLNWSGRQISAFLRAMDYGPLQTMGSPIVNVCGNRYSVVSYKQEIDSTIDYSASIMEMSECGGGASILAIQKGEYRFVMQLEKVS